jgi:hypothetical protein
MPQMYAREPWHMLDQTREPGDSNAKTFESRPGTVSPNGSSQVELISLAAQGWAFAEPFLFLSCQVQPQAFRNLFGDFLLHIEDISQLAAVACTP